MVGDFGNFPLFWPWGLLTKAFSYKISVALIINVINLTGLKQVRSNHFMKKIAYLSAAILPSLAFAATVGSVLSTIKNILDLLIPIFITLAVLYFFWGLGQYILNSNDSEKKEEGRNIMIWGILALFVMVSVWGIIGVISNTFGIGTGGTIQIPRI